MNNALTLLKKIQSLCEQGQHFAHNDFDLQRYKEIESTVFALIQDSYLTSDAKLPLVMQEMNGYKTPKVDVRAVVFNEKGEVLMVKEKIDGKWSLPGGWADIGYTPSEVAVKETHEEAGIIIKPGRLVAVMDKKKHTHPDDLLYIYKIFIEGHIVRYDQPDNLETTDVGFFGFNNLPQLSTPRNTREQIKILFDYHSGLLNEPYID